jgi:hypothetical protein
MGNEDAERDYLDMLDEGYYETMKKILLGKEDDLSHRP